MEWRKEKINDANFVDNDNFGVDEKEKKETNGWKKTQKNVYFPTLLMEFTFCTKEIINNHLLSLSLSIFLLSKSILIHGQLIAAILQ